MHALRFDQNQEHVYQSDTRTLQQLQNNCLIRILTYPHSPVSSISPLPKILDDKGSISQRISFHLDSNATPNAQSVDEIRASTDEILAGNIRVSITARETRETKSLNERGEQQWTRQARARTWSPRSRRAARTAMKS